MRRSPLKRGRPLQRGAWLTRRTRIRPANRERRLELYERNFGERAEIIRAMPCIVAGRGSECWGPIEAAHVRSRGAGGTRRDLVPLCSAHHREQHQGVKTFAERYGLDLRAAADQLATELDGRRIP